MKIHYCQKCETRRVCKGVRFCIDCCREINRARESQMERTRAAVCYLNANGPGDHKKVKLAAFLSIFHPEISESRARRIIHGVE